MCNQSILAKCIYSKASYNLVTETIEDIDNATVINSVSTDIEILKAIVGILSLILTSNQFLSVNRSYDKRVNRDQVRQQAIKDKEDIAQAVTSAVMSTIANNRSRLKDISDFIVSIFSRINKR
jgi:hypothetical protein